MKMFSKWVLVFSIAVAVLVITAGFGVRMEWWGYPMGFTLLRYGFFAAAACAAAAMIVITLSLLKRIPIGVAVVCALLINAALVLVPALYLSEFRKITTVGEASTDFQNLPNFDVLANELRASEQEPPLFTLEEAEAAQREHFPELGPVTVSLEPAAAKAQVVNVLTDMGLTIAPAGAGELRVEATQTTFWFGFRDDVVVEISGLDEGGSLVNVRSASRVGKFDGGANAKRVEAILQGLNASGA